MERPNIDNLINWEQFYRERILSPIKSAGQNKMHCCCPFHEEQNPSFWFNTTNGLWKCETGCGSGNATQFLAKLKNVSTADAYKELCALAGVETKPAKKPKEKNTVATYTVREYALEKRLPEDWLRSIGVSDGGTDKLGGGFISIEYRNEQGGPMCTRKRYSPISTQRFSWYRGSKAALYGLWQLTQIKAAGYVVLVEGESDAQTLWHLGISALGVPGATTFQQEWAEKLLGIATVYLHIEPGDGGQAFLYKTTRGLLDGGFAGQVKTFSCDARDGCKDPSDLLALEGDNASTVLRGMLQKAGPINLAQAAVAKASNLTDPPVNLAMPRDWRVSDSGIEQYSSHAGRWERVSWTPMLITRVLPSATSGEVKIELAFRRAGKWRTTRQERGALASSRRIVDALADHGINITTENAKGIVTYFSELEYANIQAIQEVPRITHYGWIDDKHFAPGLCEGYYFDKDGISGKWGDIGTPKGSYDVWKREIGKHRNKALFRFIVSAGLASPLLRLLGQRIFMIYNWHDSRGGKTSAMYCSLSAWGDPEHIRGNFNTTQVGIERMAGLFCDLPLGINEKQLAGEKQDFLQKLVYMLSEGTGRLRGNTRGSLQEQTTWRCIVMASGEEPLTVNSSMTGVSTRALEICGRPFGEGPEAEEDAAEMYFYTAHHHGHAGVDFVKRLVEFDRNMLLDIFDRMRKAFSIVAVGRIKSHVASVAVVAVADYLASQWIWEVSEADAWLGAVGMGKEIIASLQSMEDTDVNERAYRHVLDWIVANRRQFTNNYQMQRYGLLECEEGVNGAPGKAHHVLILPSKLEEELTRAKYSHQKTLRWMAEKGCIDVDMRSGRPRFRVRRQFEGTRMEFVRFALPTDAEMGGFTIVDDSELPPEWDT